MPLILEKPLEINNRLASFGFKPGDMIEILDAVKGGASEPTADHPPTARGTYAYHESTAQLRRVGRRCGYERSDDRNVPSVINRNLGVRIVVASTDEVTGLRLGARIPKRRNDLGTVHLDNIASGQIDMFAAIEREQEATLELVKFPSRGILTYFLCYHWWIDGEGEFRVRGELSFCDKVSGSNFQSFRERTLIVPEAFDLGSPPEAESEDYDISVEPLAK